MVFLTNLIYVTIIILILLISKHLAIPDSEVMNSECNKCQYNKKHFCNRFLLNNKMIKNCVHFKKKNILT